MPALEEHRKVVRESLVQILKKKQAKRLDAQSERLSLYSQIFEELILVCAAGCGKGNMALTC